MNRIYMDNAATTRLHPEVLAAMTPCLTDVFGNPSSQHAFGREANRALEKARRQVARALGASPEEIFFTSGGTEADNWALTGLLHDIGKYSPKFHAVLGDMRLREGRNRLITTRIEHHAVLHPAERLAQEGFEVAYLSPDAEGFISPEPLKEALDERTALVSVMAANNEVGSVQPVEALASLAHEAGALFHTDAVQAAGCLPFDLAHSQIDMLSLSAHKFHGPKGVGALYVRSGLALTPLIGGGAQEKSLRAGTENLAGIVGLGEAIERAHIGREARNAHVAALRDRLERGLLALPGAHRNGPAKNRLPGILNVRFDGQLSSALLLRLDMRGLAVSAGSACTAGSTDPSHVLLALGLDERQANESIRFSLSDDNTEAEVDAAIALLRELLA